MNYLRKDALVQWVFCPEIGDRTVAHTVRWRAETQWHQCFTRMQAVRLWLPLCATDGLQRFMDPEIPVVGSLAITWNCTNEVRLR